MKRIKEFTPTQIKEVRRTLGMTQAEFGQYLGVGPSTVPRWELGMFRPSKYLMPLLRKAAKEAGYLVSEE